VSPLHRRENVGGGKPEKLGPHLLLSKANGLLSQDQSCDSACVREAMLVPEIAKKLGTVEPGSGDVHTGGKEVDAGSPVGEVRLDVVGVRSTDGDHVLLSGWAGSAGVPVRVSGSNHNNHSTANQCRHAKWARCREETTSSCNNKKKTKENQQYTPVVNDTNGNRGAKRHVCHRLVGAVLVGLSDPGQPSGDVKDGADARVPQDLDGDAMSLLGHTDIATTHSASHVGSMSLEIEKNKEFRDREKEKDKGKDQ